MAKVNGPLFSMDASGKFAGALVFTKWKGRPVVRQLVTPSNPQTTTQEDSRNRVRVAGAGQHWADMTALLANGETLTDKERLQAVAPSGQAWNGFLVKSIIGAGYVNYAAATAAYAALTGGNRTSWDAAAAALVPAIPAVNQTEEFGVTGTPLSAGAVFFHYAWGLYVAGTDGIPGAVPNVYA